MATKNEQIIIRLSKDKKKKLQEIADRKNIDMSKLIRDKIDQIINENENKRVLYESNKFIRDNIEKMNNIFITDDLIEELKDEFKKIFIDKMKKDIDSINTTKSFKDK